MNIKERYFKMAKVKGFYVTLTEDVSEENALTMAKAISLLKGVVSVTHVPTKEFEDIIAAIREKSRIRENLIQFIKVNL